MPFGLFTGQIGYAWNTVLLYAKGGAAVTDKRSTRRPAIGAARRHLEFSFAPNWSAAVEYDHLFMGSRTRTSSRRPPAFTRNVDLVTARVNYRWGGPVIAKY